MGPDPPNAGSASARSSWRRRPATDGRGGGQVVEVGVSLIVAALSAWMSATWVVP